MKLVFFGSSNFSLPFLDCLFQSSHEIALVVTQPDRPKGRGYKLSRTPIKEFAEKNKINIFQPPDINSSGAVKFLKEIKADLFVVVAYGNILSPEVLKIPKVFSLNVHASLLPVYRGAAPIAHALINGEASTGITIIKMEEKVDTGPIIAQRSLNIDDQQDALTLEEKLGNLGKSLIRETIDKISKNNFSLTTQDKLRVAVSYAPKLKKEEGLIDWSKSAEQISNLIRGCIAWPVSYTYFRGKLLKIYKAVSKKNCPPGYKPGEIISSDKQGILVACGQDCLLVNELQIEGKRRMTSREFILGHQITKGEVFYVKK